MSYYDFIPVDGVNRVSIPWDIFESRGKIRDVHMFDLFFVTLTETSVGSGEKGYDDEDQKLILRALRNSSGRIIIPGSSMKGVVSTNYLILTGSCKETSECFGTSAQGWIDRKNEKNSSYGPAVSKVLFSDLVPTEENDDRREIQRAWPPPPGKNGHVKIYTGIAPPTTAYGDIECLPKGVLLSTTIVGTELSSYELGGLLMSLGCFPKDDMMVAGIMKVGYGKPQGLGRIRLDVDRSHYRRCAVSLTGLRSVLDVPLNSPECMKLVRGFARMVIARERALFEYWKKIFVPGT
ncbi:MAG: hypothetical protein QXS20_08910 [Candidatus Thorarchaeota archaeon]